MTKYTYQISVSTQLGQRSGTLSWTEQSGSLNGTLELLGQSTPLSGRRVSADACDFSGEIRTIVSRIPYRAVCTLSSSGTLQGTFYTSSGDFAVHGRAALHS